MIPNDISQSKDPDQRASLAAMERAAEMAREIAIRTNTHLVVSRDGKVVRLSAQDLLAERSGEVEEKAGEQALSNGDGR